MLAPGDRASQHSIREAAGFRRQWCRRRLHDQQGQTSMRRTFHTIILGAAALAFTATGASAQTIGFKLGAGFANMTSDALGVTSQSITGFAGGGHIRFGGRIGLQAELLSVTKGANFRGGADLTGDSDVRFEYVEIPVLLHVPLTMGMVAPYVFAGGAVGLEVRCRITPADGPEVGSERDCGDDTATGTNSTDWGLVGGAGIRFPLGPGSALVEGRYTHGLRTINTSGADNWRHRVPTVMVGYEIPLVRTF
jgi:hypothetical protein